MPWAVPSVVPSPTRLIFIACHLPPFFTIYLPAPASPSLLRHLAHKKAGNTKATPPSLRFCPKISITVYCMCACFSPMTSSTTVVLSGSAPLLSLAANNSGNSSAKNNNSLNARASCSGGRGRGVARRGAADGPSRCEDGWPSDGVKSTRRLADEDPSPPPLPAAPAPAIKGFCKTGSGFQRSERHSPLCARRTADETNEIMAQTSSQSRFSLFPRVGCLSHNKVENKQKTQCHSSGCRGATGSATMPPTRRALCPRDSVSLAGLLPGLPDAQKKD